MIVQTPHVKVGTLIGDDKGEILKNGAYKIDGKICSAIFGTVKRQTQNGKQIINVESEKNKNVGLQINDILICKVIKIREDGAWVEVLQINNTPTKSIIEGFIRRQLIREKQIDKIKVHQSFLPGDIVRAQFVSFGDGRRIYLSTSGESLGVIYAKSSASGKLMLPYSWTEMVCMQTGLKQSRKVAKPDV